MVSYSFYIVINVHPKDDTDRRKDSDNLNGINYIHPSPKNTNRDFSKKDIKIVKESMYSSRHS